MSAKDFIIETDHEDQSSLSDRNRDMSMSMANVGPARVVGAEGENNPSRTAAVVVVPEKRRRFTTQQKLELVRLSYLPGNSVSCVAREYGVAPSLLFRWRSLDKAGGLTAVESNQATVSAAKYEAALDEIKRLQRLLGQATADNALLKDAVEIMQSKKWIAR